MRRIILLVCLAFAALAAAPLAGAQLNASIPLHGVFVPGKTLAGVGLGYTEAQVTAHWGARHTLCTEAPLCTAASPVWLFEYPTGEPLGVAVRFRNDKAVAVFTLGAVGVNSLSAGGGGGWKTTQGLHITDPISQIYTLYPAATIQTNCNQYGALSMRQGSVTTSFYTSTGTVYGFALTVTGQPVCE